MSGNGRRGRRGGRRQRRREEHGRQQTTPTASGAPAPSEAAATVVIEQERAEPPVPVHPRPMSARELVARLEALHAHEEAAAAEALVVAEATEMPAPIGPIDAPPPAVLIEPRRFLARGAEWLAYVAGRGTGGTGRVAVARIGAIRFATAAEPDTIAAEVISPHTRLDDLYDEELAELLERGLRWTKGNA